MRAMNLKPPSLLLLALAIALPTTAAARLGATDRAWIDSCIDRLRRENSNQQVVRRYCTCMHGYFEDNANASQSEMEQMYPPAHRLCRKQSRWK
jgi:hypothetical protein